MAGRKLSAKDVGVDIKAGMDDEALKTKYGLTDKQLAALYEKLIEKGLLDVGDLYSHTTVVEFPEADSPASASPDLIAAVKSKDLAKLVTLVQENADLNVPDTDGATPVIVAAREGNESIAQFLVYSGADTSFKDASGKTALDWAAEKGNENIVLLLRGKRFSCPACGKVHGHPFEECPKCGVIVRKFYDRIPFTRSKSGQTPPGSGQAVNKGPHPPTPEYANALTGQPKVTPTTNLEEMVFSEQQGIGSLHWQRIISWLSNSTHGYQAAGALFSVVIVVAVVASLGPDRNTVSKQEKGTSTKVSSGAKGDSPAEHSSEAKDMSPAMLSARLLEAARKGQVPDVEGLLKRGVDVHSRGTGGNTALHWASYMGHVDVVKVLLSRGAAVDIRDKSEQTPLILAALGGRPEVARILLSNGANVNAKSKVNGKSVGTALMFASQNNDIRLIEILLSAGANINEINGNGSTALDFVLPPNQNVKRLLESRGGKSGSRVASSRNAPSTTFSIELDRALREIGSADNALRIHRRNANHFAGPPGRLLCSSLQMAIDGCAVILRQKGVSDGERTKQIRVHLGSYRHGIHKAIHKLAAGRPDDVYCRATDKGIEVIIRWVAGVKSWQSDKVVPPSIASMELAIKEICPSVEMPDIRTLR